MFKVNNKSTRTISLSSVSVADFEQVNVNWEEFNPSVPDVH